MRHITIPSERVEDVRTQAMTIIPVYDPDPGITPGDKIEVRDEDGTPVAFVEVRVIGQWSVAGFCERDYDGYPAEDTIVTMKQWIEAINPDADVQPSSMVHVFMTTNHLPL